MEGVIFCVNIVYVYKFYENYADVNVLCAVVDSSLKIRVPDEVVLVKLFPTCRMSSTIRQRT